MIKIKTSIMPTVYKKKCMRFKLFHVYETPFITVINKIQAPPEHLNTPNGFKFCHP